MGIYVNSMAANSVQEKQGRLSDLHIRVSEEKSHSEQSQLNDLRHISVVL